MSLYDRLFDIVARFKQVVDTRRRLPNCHKYSMQTEAWFKREALALLNVEKAAKGITDFDYVATTYYTFRPYSHFDYCAQLWKGGKVWGIGLAPTGNTCQVQGHGV